MHILILGGTSEASALVNLLAAKPEIRATLSLAGRTERPVLPAIAHRIGGFGGVQGLAHWIREHNVTALIDATHPFARIMPFNAERAARETGIPLLRLTRPEWQPQAGDNWFFASSHEEAIRLLGHNPRRVFLTVGRLELAAYASATQHFYLARSIDAVEPKPLANAVWIQDRPPFTIESETALIREHNIDTIITKNSGGKATSAKLAAARANGCNVILINRPPRPEAETVTSANDALAWIHNASL